MVQEAKKNISKRYLKTGGGPQPKVKQASEFIIEIHWDNSPMFWGIDGGIESGVSGRERTTRVQPLSDTTTRQNASAAELDNCSGKSQ